MKITREIVDALVPDHTTLRYHEPGYCNDENRAGGSDFEKLEKEWCCKRCLLLDYLDGHGFLKEDDIFLDINFGGIK